MRSCSLWKYDEDVLSAYAEVPQALFFQKPSRVGAESFFGFHLSLTENRENVDWMDEVRDCLKKELGVADDADAVAVSSEMTTRVKKKYIRAISAAPPAASSTSLPANVPPVRSESTVTRTSAEPPARQAEAPLACI